MPGRKYDFTRETLCDRCKERKACYKVKRSRYLLKFLNIAFTERKVFNLCYSCAKLFSIACRGEAPN